MSCSQLNFHSTLLTGCTLVSRLLQSFIQVFTLAFVVVGATCVIMIPIMLHMLQLQQFGWNWIHACMFGAMIASTDAVAIVSIMKTSEAQLERSLDVAVLATWRPKHLLQKCLLRLCGIRASNAADKSIQNSITSINLLPIDAVCQVTVHSISRIWYPCACLAAFPAGGGPKRLRVMLEGESLLNDASGLTLFEVFFHLVRLTAAAAMFVAAAVVTAAAAVAG
jgi:hypothetical protein